MEFILNVTYTMKPGLRAEFLREVSEHGIQKAVLAEEGCLQYQYFEVSGLPLLPPGGGGRHPAAGGAVDRTKGPGGPYDSAPYGPPKGDQGALRGRQLGGEI